MKTQTAERINNNTKLYLNDYTGNSERDVPIYNVI